MFTMTETAGAHLAAMLSSAEAPDDVFVRLEQEEGGWALQLGNARAGDSTFTYQGQTVLVLDEEQCQLLADSTLDVDDTEKVPRLRLL